VPSLLTLGAGTPLLLRRLRGLARWPTLAAWLWLGSSVAALAAVALAGLLLLLPTDPLGPDVAELLRTCVMALRTALSTPPDGSAATVAGTLLVAIVAGGLLVGGSVAGLRARRAADRHQDLLALAGRPAVGLPGVTVLEHGRPFAYCLPGQHGPVVLSSTALRRLDAGQLDAVLAHERAHQAGRHHRLVLLAQLLRVGFPWLPAARLVSQAVPALVELAADDAAARAQGRRQVAAALAALGDAPVPTAALGCRRGLGHRAGQPAADTPAARGCADAGGRTAAARVAAGRAAAGRAGAVGTGGRGAGVPAGLIAHPHQSAPAIGLPAA
jgi:Zn-dependent protease with chaperone function